MRFLAPLTLLAVLAVAAPAQAEVTASVITTPESPRFVLSKGPGTGTLDIAGRVTGAGNIDIVCRRDQSWWVLAADVPVATDRTFAVDDVPVDPLVFDRHGSTCRLRALPAGGGDPASASFQGPMLGVSTYVQARVSGGPNDAMLTTYFVHAAGVDRETQLDGALGSRCGVVSTFLDPNTLQTSNYALTCAGFLASDPYWGSVGLRIDNAAVQPAAALGADLQAKPGFPRLEITAFDFDPSTGAITITERNTLAKCGPHGTDFPTSADCAALDPVPVTHVRTTTVPPGDQPVRIVDRWTSADGRPHRLDFALDQELGSSSNIVYRFPGETTYAEHDHGDVIGHLPAGAPLVARDLDGAQSGVVVLPLQSPDAAVFFGGENYTLEYERTIPATGELTLTHYFLSTRRSDDVEAAAAKLLASLAKPAGPAPHGSGGGGQTVMLPRFSRHGRLRVRRAGRTFRVVTRDRVTCPAACTVHVSGRRVAATDLPVAAGKTAAVRFRLTRGGARKLRRAGRLRLHIALTSGAVTARRTLTVRVPA